MEADAPATASKRPRPILLVMLGVVVVAFLAMQVSRSTDPTPAPSNPRAPQQRAGGEAGVDPSQLDVHLDSLTSERPGPGESERNPFRFQPKPPPPPPPQPPGGSRPLPPPQEVPDQPPAPAAPPPITVKFVGTLDLPDGSKLAVVTDCTSGHKTVQVRQGESVLGQYRLVKIGETSIVIEHLDGRGRTTLAKNGQECIWK
jgi:hypothetical protein